MKLYLITTLVFALLLSNSLLSPVPSFAASDGFLTFVPHDLTELSSQEVAGKIKVVLAGNEEEMLFLRLEGNGRLVFNSVTGKDSAISAEFFEVLRVPVKSGGLLSSTDHVFDPMLPLKDGLVATDKLTPHLIVIKIKAKKSALPGKRLMQIVVNRADREHLSFNVSVEVSRITLPNDTDLTLQAAVWMPGEWYLSRFDTSETQIQEKEIIVELIRFLRRYRINALSRLWERYTYPEMTWNTKDIETYNYLATHALNDLGYRLIRLPNPIFFWGKKHFDKVYGFNKNGLNNWLADIDKFLGQFSELLDDSRWQGKFAYEIWDEPWRNQIPQVNTLYKLFEKKYPDILKQLTREPYAVEGMEDIADIWAIGLPRFDGNQTNKIQQRGDKVWLYANRWHGVDRRVTDVRAIGWALWQYRLDGYFLWGINRWKEDPWTTVSNKKTDHFKRATFVYPHPETGAIIPSLRLEFFREGIEDLMLLKKLQKKNNTKYYSIFPQKRPEYKVSLPNFKQIHDELLSTTH